MLERRARLYFDYKVPLLEKLTAAAKRGAEEYFFFYGPVQAGHVNRVKTCERAQTRIFACHTMYLALKDSLEATMFGYGLLGTLLVIALIVWIIRKL